MKRILNHIPTRNLAVVAVLLAAVGRAASAQEATGNLEGRVASVDGAGLASVTVTASGPSLQRRRQMSTDERGYFRMLALPVGEYTVRVTQIGYRPASRPPSGTGSRARKREWRCRAADRPRRTARSEIEERWEPL